MSGCHLRSLRAHLQDTRAHLAGAAALPHASPTTGSSPPAGGGACTPEPAVVWSSSLSAWSQSEVDAFFHAVSIYSRWRPDLIAEALKPTKSEVEVVEFLVVLDATARSAPLQASPAAAAMDVSHKWVAAEEAMAAAVAAEEVHDELEGLEALRRKRVRDARADIVHSGKRRRLSPAATPGAQSRDIAHSEAQPLFDKWHAHEIAACRRQDLLAKLGETHLQVMDAILREDEERSLVCKPAGTPDPDAARDLGALSPTSRRRLTKRLYMRRKRAQLRGEDVFQAGDASVGFVRLKPGRKVRGEASGNAALPELDLEATDDDEADVRQLHGKTLYQKIRAEFDHAGIDASYLHERGLGLLHHSFLGRLLGLYNWLEQCPEDELNTSYISAELTGYLQALVVAFTTDLIRRAIMWKEEANELKGEMKVWKGALQEKINQAAVEHALHTMGARTANRHEHFSKLIDRYDLSLAKQTRRSTLSVDTRARGSLETGLSGHRAIYTPALLAPSAFHVSVVDTFFAGYDSCFRSDARSETEDTPLSDGTDEEALEDELQEDEMMDKDDVENGKRYEEQLWADVEEEEEEEEDV